jgi:hypothetical protein
MLLDTELLDDGQTQPGHVSYHKKGNEHDDDEGDAGPIES